MSKLLVGLGVLIAFSLTAHGQANIEVGTWRYHFSYNSIKSVDHGVNEVYAAAGNGLMIYHSDGEIERLNKLNGLTNAGISVLRYDKATKQLLVAYGDGTFDAIKNNFVRNVNPATNTVISGSKQIHSISVNGGMAYFATDYGVLLFDLQSSRIKETWRDLGPGGSTIPVYQIAFTTDSVFIATGNGIMAGRLTDNLLDFSKWKRYNTDDFTGPMRFIASFAGRIITALDNKGLYHFENGSWIRDQLLEGRTFTFLRAGINSLFAGTGSELWQMAPNGSLVQLSVPQLSIANDAADDQQGNIWIGDAENGLLGNRSGSFIQILPDGPVSDSITRLVYDNGRIYALTGGYNPSRQPMLNEGTISLFDDGAWTNETYPQKDFTAMAFSPRGETFVSSFGYGVIEKADVVTVWDESNSPLENNTPSTRAVLVSDIAYSQDGLWVANFGATRPLHRLSEGQWTSFSFPVSASAYPERLITDPFQNVWMTLNAGAGGGILVYDSRDDKHRRLTNIAGNGFLPSNTVYDLVSDRDGYVWAGTAEGVVYFYDYEADGVRPIFERGFLLVNEKVRSLAVDGGNRKWMGTERGLWLFNPTGEELVANFTSANSPLPSDEIVDIEINQMTGEVFIATANGLVSYRADATAAGPVFSEVKIFPNPVDSNFSGLVGISGVASDAIIKITDISGKLMWQTQANGGTAAWNVRDAYGRRVPTGIFLVYAVAQDGSASIVGKIAVIN